MENIFKNGFCTFAQAEAFCKELTKRGYAGGVAPNVGVTADERLKAATEDWEKAGIFLYPWDWSQRPQVGDAFWYAVRFNNGCSPGNIALWMDLFSPEKRVPAENVWRRIEAEIQQAMKDQGI